MENALEQALQPMPEHKCADCTKSRNEKCLCFNRPIDLDYNKCYFHSFYTPCVINFEPPENLEEIMEQEEREREASLAMAKGARNAGAKRCQ